MNEPKGRLSRRTLFAGAGTAGAIATVASMLPAQREPQAPVPQAKSPPPRGGGYELTEHVQRYYRSTRV